MENDPDISELIAVSKIEWKGSVSFWLTFSSKIPIAEAVAASYLLASKDHLKDRAKYLQDSILNAFIKSKEMTWPPTLEDITSEPLPEELQCFLNLVLSGNEPEMVQDDRTKRFIYSIGHDVCRAVSQGRWKLAKHILICITIRHLYRSKQLTTILNRLCHCESYSFGIELETAMAYALEEENTYLTPQIVSGESNEVFHNEWDNLNKIFKNVTESNVANSAAGIMLQEVKGDTGSTSERTLPTAARSKEQSLKVDAPTTLAPVTIYNHVGPNFLENAVISPPADNDTELKKCMKEYDIWMLCR